MSCRRSPSTPIFGHYNNGCRPTFGRVASLVIAFCALLPAISANALADEVDYQCPQKIAYVENEPMSQKAIVILQKVYADLGCPLQAVKLPGRRGPLHFNEGLVDGELLRAIPAEKNYARAFVRSSVPLREISNRLWRNPNDDDPQTPIAFTLGVAWQEKFAKTNTDKTGVPTKPMMFNTELYEAYANGRITRFLAADTNIDDMIAKDILGDTPAPVIEETISVLPLFHYLGAEYAPFMTKFSELVAKTDPFRSPQAE